MFILQRRTTYFFPIMKVLQLVNRIPYPLNDGGNLAVYFYTEGFLKAGVSLSMLAMNTTRHWVSEDTLPDTFNQLDYFQTIKVDNRIKVLPALLNLFSKRSYNVSRFISKDFENALVHLLREQKYDIVQLEGLYLTPYVSTIRRLSNAKIVLRQHNAEFLIWERLAQQEQFFPRKKYLQLLAERLKKYEQSVLNNVDFLLPISQADASIFQSLGATKPFFIQAFGLDISKIPFVPAAKPPVSIYHIGAMDWQPNQEGVFYFLEKVMPAIKTILPNLQLHLAGRNMSKGFFQYSSESVLVYGEVPDAASFEKDKSILVVPLLSGGGVRIKIFRAMAMGKAIVSTRVGMEGINITNGQEAFVAKDAAEMAEQIIYLARHPEKIEDMGKAARAFIELHYNQEKMIRELLEKYSRLVKS